MTKSVALDLTNQVKENLESDYAIKGGCRGEISSYTELSEEDRRGLIDYLTKLEGVTCSKAFSDKHPCHEQYVFLNEKIGDRLTINIYATGTLTLQGKIVYLYSEALFYFAYLENVSMEGIVGSLAEKTCNVKVEDEIRTMLPKSYNYIDKYVIRLISPSIFLRNADLEMDDYSCYAFPALRALEGYLKDLFKKYGISVGHSFGEIFSSAAALTRENSDKIGDEKCVEQLENLYDFFRKQRHTLFHANEVLPSTRILSKEDANSIVNEVFLLIENSFDEAFYQILKKEY